MFRKVLWSGAIIVVCVMGWAFTCGPLFPWSPVTPAYDTLRLARADIFVPRGQVLDSAYLKVDQFLAEGELFHKLPGPARLRVIACRNWEDFARFCPFVRGRAVGAVTLEVGGVISVTPKLAEKRLDVAEFLRHEISHAIVAHNASLWRIHQMKQHSWLYEGVPVWFGRQKSFVTQTEFFSRAAGEDLWPVISFDSNRAAPPDIRFSYIAWRDFLDYLAQARGMETFIEFFHAYIKEPAALDALFEKAYGKPARAMVREFSSAIDHGRYAPSE
jgi:hypothetical protein